MKKPFTQEEMPAKRACCEAAFFPPVCASKAGMFGNLKGGA